MKTSDLFPTKLILFNLIALITVLILLIFAIARNKKFVTTFYTKDIPAFQYYCAGSKLISVNQILEKYEASNHEQIRSNQKEILTSVNKLLTMEGAQYVLNSNLVKRYQTKMADENSVLTQEELTTLNQELQSYIDLYFLLKIARQEKNAKFSSLIAFVGIIGLIIFLIILGYIYRIYQNNLNELSQINKHLEDERAYSMQSAKLASLGEMAGGIAHEINNPLAIIAATSHFIRRSQKREKLSPEILESSLDDIDKTILRISKIIIGLKNISRESTEETLVPTRIGDVFDDVFSVCSEKLKNHNVELIIEGRELLELDLKCARVQLSQVFLNLLVNAFDAVKEAEEKWIKIALSRNENTLKILISDSGKKIPQSVSEKMFQPFFTTKDIGKGTGLGLSLSRSIIKSHGGSLDLDLSKPNTTFMIQMPIS